MAINESQYRSLFKNILKKNSGLINIGASNEAVESESNEKNDDNSSMIRSNYKAETDLIQNAISFERNAVLSGIVIGIAAFSSFRYGPNYLIKRFGGEKKVRALMEAEEASRNGSSMTWALKKGFALGMEVFFGVWAGVRGYTMASKELLPYSSNTWSRTNSNDQTKHHNKSMFDEISRIPLVEGRSIVAETICEEWIDVAYNKVPNSFWKVVKTENDKSNDLQESIMPNILNTSDNKIRLADPRAWKAIADFAINCQKRKKFTDELRKKKDCGNDDKDYLVLPSPGVPSNIVLDKDLFSDKEES